MAETFAQYMAKHRVVRPTRKARVAKTTTSKLRAIARIIPADTTQKNRGWMR